MPIWPFKRRTRPNQSDNAAAATEKPKQAPATQPPTSTAAAASPPPSHIAPTRRASFLRKQRRASHQHDSPSSPLKKELGSGIEDSANKENVKPTSRGNAPPPALRPHSSREDITALPITHKLEQSPHLRPVQLDRPGIPYNFRPYSMSQTSLQRQEAIVKPQRPNTLHSKRSTTDYSSPRRTSSKQSRYRDEKLREEEIRAMSSPIPIPKRPGDGPLRRDSKKVRGLIGKDSEVSLPPQGSVHSAMSGILEQRGWELGGSFAALSPRPNVRLSGVPQYVPNSIPGSTSGVLYRIDSTRVREKAPVTPDAARKRKTVGREADDLDASDIRAIMEREAKRREKRQQERHEKLERKLRSREGRNRGDSDARRQREAEQERPPVPELARSRASTNVAEQIQSYGAVSPPTAVHPALRNLTAEEEAVPMGLGIARAQSPDEPMDVDRQQEVDMTRLDEYGYQNTVLPSTVHEEEQPENPFVDAPEEPILTPREEQPPTASGTSLPMETPMSIGETPFSTVETPLETPVVRTAQAVRYSVAHTPPLSPVYPGRVTSSASELAGQARGHSIAEESSDLPRPPPIIPVERRSSDPPKDKPGRAWSTIFRRGGTNLRKDRSASPSEFSFSNTSRESMRNRPLPAHLVDTQASRPPAVRSKSGTPVRTQSKFREDLPEMPISPPDSRTQSPDVMTNAAAIAVARRAGRSTPQSVDIPGRVREADRNDTPTSQSMRSHGGAVAGSLASIDSEGEWLAGATKRSSQQSGLSRSFSKRQGDPSASYEELGTDKDAEYIAQGRRPRKLSSPALMGASPDEESEEDGPMDPAVEAAEGTAPTMHGSVRRRPTLVQRTPQMKSREGLVTEFAAAAHTGDDEGEDDYEPDSPGPQLERATSIQYGQGTGVARHSRHFSAGSAKLLDVGRASPSLSITPEPGASPRDTPQ